jgi:hypothetical protein
VAASDNADCGQSFVVKLVDWPTVTDWTAIWLVNVKQIPFDLRQAVSD